MDRPGVTPLHALAEAAGVARLWIDADGVEQEVSDDSLRAIVAALGAPMEARRSHLITAECGEPVALPPALRGGTLLDGAGVAMQGSADSLRRTGIAAPGYYCLALEDGSITIAVAPQRCRAVDRRCWGVSVQIASLRDDGDFGDFASLAQAVAQLGERGADAVALSPVHALSIEDAGRFAPYSPSSRLALNALFGAAAGESGSAPGDLIDWALAGPAKLAALQRRHQADPGNSADFEDFLQRNARAGLDAVQRAARDAGMAIGLITDLAVGVDPAGAEARADPQLFLQGLRIGAPPDPLGPMGQDWGLTSYSPNGLIDSGFAPFIAMLRANIPAAGGIRIDHAFGLQRLWVVPEGRPASEGAYLAYPFADLLRLVKLEAWRADAIVIAEDLGTRPPGFSEALQRAGIHGMAVLPFARDAQGGFLPAAAYPAGSVAMSATHDTPTVAGWWTGRDLDWNRRLARGGESAAQRATDRAALWRVIGEGAPQPGDDDPAPVVDRAIAFLAATPAPLLIVPIEDLVGQMEQPNLPGTIDEHPNWRRRLPEPIDALLRRDDVTRRITRLNQERGA